MCQEVPIMEVAENGSTRPSAQYREHYIEITNGTLLRVGVCESCRPLLISGENVLENAKRILDAHKIFWASENPIGDYDSLDVVDPNTDEKKFLEKRKESEQVEEDALSVQKESCYRELEVREPARIRKETEEENKKRQYEKEIAENIRKNKQEKEDYQDHYQAIQL